LKARNIRRQRAEAHARALAMNKMTRLGMPKGVWVSYREEQKLSR
jgi:hypothetical protein